MSETLKDKEKDDRKEQHTSIHIHKMVPCGRQDKSNTNIVKVRDGDGVTRNGNSGRTRRKNV